MGTKKTERVTKQSETKTGTRVRAAKKVSRAKASSKAAAKAKATSKPKAKATEKKAATKPKAVKVTKSAGTKPKATAKAKAAAKRGVEPESVVETVPEPLRPAPVTLDIARVSPPPAEPSAPVDSGCVRLQPSR